ncbi:folylpolyglutamate synthase/dihydrofolate synthase family protein [Sediminibacterium sp.]|uniref:bifunctional folylpolyglutamate synthase/dihydrofolate synthase n=1 Tax=Sediminibacterium sp. TaxID=1917865 RepID=UPI0025F7EC57|nr:folylpolyglutamate synthase/dihydrofolate synthase family protein [Sediminibacterium sp.]MBT9484841.1 bifunctional folylpolyglutamate synthase/dihydrofolate synthase [Sediminibacterium sp.]
MNYAETVSYLFNQLPMFSKIGEAAYKKDLTNTIALCEALDNPHKKFKSIHIAGTNGKGSTSHMLAAIMQAAGLKTGLYTSPHLYDFRERIKINGVCCSEEFVINFTQRIQHQIETIAPSFFEITVAMAFDYFAENEVDIAIIETGLGGRLDSTNIILPELSIITNIGMDHMNLLGNTLTAIAGEKAGIIKPFVPVVIGEFNKETLPVFIAAAQSSPISFAENERYISDWLYQQPLLNVTVVDKSKNEYQHYALDLTGFYQTKNLLTVLEACKVLQKNGWNIQSHDIKEGLSNVKKLTGLQGRWEIIQTNPTLVLDVGHNVDGIKAILTQLDLSNFKQLHWVMGMVKDKDIQAVLQLLPSTAKYYFTKASIPRALDEQDLLIQAKEFGLSGTAFKDVNSAIDAAKENADFSDLILVCGSVFVIAEVNRHLN